MADTASEHLPPASVTALPAAPQDPESIEELPPSPYGDGPPYPESTDRVDTVAYCLHTGDIKQRTRSALVDMFRHHSAFPDHGCLEVTGIAAAADTHVVDLTTLTVKERTTPTVGQRSLKALELRNTAVVSTFQSSALGTSNTYAVYPNIVNDMMIASVISGPITIAGVPTAHTVVQAKQAMTDYAAANSAKQTALAAQLAQVAAASTIDVLNAI